MNTLQTRLQQALELLNSPEPDLNLFHALESYAIAGSSRLAADPDYQRLRQALDTFAQAHNLPTLQKQQETFGLNSCAQ